MMGLNEFLKTKITVKTEFSKLFIKKNGKLYSSLIPQFFKKFSISHTKSNLKCEQIIRPKHFQQFGLVKLIELY